MWTKLIMMILKGKMKILYKQQHRLQESNRTKENHAELTHFECPLDMNVKGTMEDDNIIFGSKFQVPMDSHACRLYEKCKLKEPKY